MRTRRLKCPLKVNQEEKPFMNPVGSSSVEAEDFHVVFHPARLPFQVIRLLDEQTGPDLLGPVDVKREATGFAVDLQQFFLIQASRIKTS